MAVFDLDPQRHFPTQIEVRPRLGFLVRNAVVDLQQNRMAQQARRHTAATVVRAVEHAELLVTKQPPALAGQEATEGVAPYEVDAKMVRFKQPALLRSLAEQAQPSGSNVGNHYGTGASR